MNSQITLSLPEEVMHRAELWAQRIGRPVGEFLAETIELSLLPLGPASAEERPIQEWTDEEVLAATDAGMAPAQDQRLSELLTQQQAGRLAGSEQTELTALMQVYQTGLLRKAQALREAARRGLRGPLES
jgi:hypothetical protein